MSTNNTNARLIRILCARPEQLSAIDQILEGPLGDEDLNDASALESAGVKTVAAAFEKPALPTRPEFECYIDKSELARRLGRTVRSVDTYMAAGIVPFYKLGRRTVAFKWSEVDAYLQSRYRVGARGRRQVVGAA